MGEIRYAIWKNRNPIASHLKLCQPRQTTDWFRESLKGVLTDVQVPQFRHPGYGIRQRCQPVVVQVEEVAQSNDFSETFRQLSKLIVAKIERPQVPHATYSR